MDFQTLKRRDLQSLCKKNNIPANTTNAAMVDALASLSVVEGLEEFLGQPEAEAQGSPERSVITSPALPRTTHRKALKEEVECSKLATGTRCGTKTKVKEGTDTRKTPATRTTRKRACQETSVKKEMEKDLQAEFDADLEQSEVSEDSVLPGIELKEISEEVSGVSVQNEGQFSESLNEAHNELQQANDGQEVIDVDDHIVNEAQDDPSESKNVDFHSLTRKDLQNLCKKNKIPANMTNAAMADALASLETVEGLQEFVKNYDSQALSSPPMPGVATSCAHRSRTTLKITTEEPQSSKLITKSCRSRRRILEEDEQVKNDAPETPVGLALYEREKIQEKEDGAVPRSEHKKLEISSMDDRECLAVFNNGEAEDPEISEASGVGEFSNNFDNSLIQETPEDESTLEDANGKGIDNVLNLKNLKEHEGLVVKMDENAVEKSSKDDEAFTVLEEISEDAEFYTVVEPQLMTNCATQLEDLKLCSRDGELENTQVQNSRSFKIDADSEFDDPHLEDLVNAPALAAEDQICKEFIFESSTHINQLLSSELNEDSNLEDSNIGNSKLENEVTITLSTVAQEVGSLAEDEVSEKSDSISTAQADKLSLDAIGESESDGSYAEDMPDDSDSESESEGSYPEEKMSKKSDFEITTQADKLREINVESESDGSCTEDDMTDNSESESESGGYTEEEMSMKSDIKTTTRGDKLLEINVESESEGSCTEDDMPDNSESESEDYTEEEMSVKSDIETTTRGDKLPEINVESESEGSFTKEEKLDSESISQEDQDINVDIESEKKKLEKLDITSDSATYGVAKDYVSRNVDTETTEAALCAPSEKNQLEKVEITTDSATYSHAVSNKIDSKTFQADLCVLTEQETPLRLKSMRKLRRMLKEKLRAVALPKSMETLEETEKPIAEVEEVLHGLPVKLSEDVQESEEGSTDALQGNLMDEALSNHQVNDSSENEAIKSDINATTLCPVDIIVDNEVIPQDAITGESTHTKFSSNIKKQPLLFTPPSKKPMPDGRKNCVLDVNKENIINSAASKTEPGKVKIAITESRKLRSTKSMGKLKKEFKVLQQQSEKKRPALQSRSENNCFLTSP